MSASTQALREWVEELRTEREQHRKEIQELDVVIRRLEKRLGQHMQPADLPRMPSSEKQDETEGTPATEGPFSDMTNPEAAKAYLSSVDSAQTTAQVREAMLAGGVTTEAKNFHSTVYTTLKRLAESGEIRDLGDGKWAAAANGDANDDGADGRLL